MSVEPLPVEVAPQWHAGVDASWAMVTSKTEHDLTLDLAQIVPEPDQ